MAEQGNGASAPDEFVADLDALAPISRQAISFEGTRYPVRHVLDLPIVEWLGLLRLEEEIDAATKAGETVRLIELAQRRLVILAPSLPDEVKQRMSYQQMTRAALAAWGAANKRDASGGPPPADAGGDSSIVSPASADSTGGRTPS